MYDKIFWFFYEGGGGKSLKYQEYVFCIPSFNKTWYFLDCTKKIKKRIGNTLNYKYVFEIQFYKIPIQYA